MTVIEKRTSLSFPGVFFSVSKCQCVLDPQAVNGSCMWFENSGWHSCNSRCHIHEGSDILVEAFVDVRGKLVQLFAAGTHVWLSISESMSLGGSICDMKKGALCWLGCRG